jgi:hypothetical protein
MTNLTLTAKLVTSLVTNDIPLTAYSTPDNTFFRLHHQQVWEETSAVFRWDEQVRTQQLSRTLVASNFWGIEAIVRTNTPTVIQEWAAPVVVPSILDYRDIRNWKLFTNGNRYPIIATP